MEQDSSTFTPILPTHISPNYPKEPLIFNSQNSSTPYLINNPDTDVYEDNFSKYFDFNPYVSLDSFN